MKAAVILAATLWAGALAIAFWNPPWANYAIAGAIVLWGIGSLVFQTERADHSHRVTFAKKGSTWRVGDKTVKAERDMSIWGLMATTRHRN